MSLIRERTMRLLRTLTIAAALSLAALSAAADQAAYPQSQDAYDAEIAKLHWKKGPGTYDLGDSHARVSLPQNIEILTGAEAERMAFLNNGIELPETVAMARTRTSDAIIYVDYYADGFVTDEDWSEIDADALLADIRDGTEAANAERASNGFAPMHTVGWLIAPTYDAAKSTARWAVELEENGERFANIQVIKLGRHGYHQITWAGPVRGADGTPMFLQTMIDSHSYDDGFRYADYVEGDQLAGFGIGALVTASAVGSKPGKGLIAAILGGGLLLAKKAWFVILGLFGAVGAFFKRLFNRGDPDTA
jgi:uncharacterized membrane-anchored protein